MLRQYLRFLNEDRSSFRYSLNESLSYYWNSSIKPQQANQARVHTLFGFTFLLPLNSKALRISLNAEGSIKFAGNISATGGTQMPRVSERCSNATE